MSTAAQNNAIPVMGSNWASQAQVSSLAYTLGQSMMVIMMIMALQALSYKLSQAQTESQGEIAKGLSQATQDSLKEQAKGLMSAGIAGMGGAGISGGFAGASMKTLSGSTPQLDDIAQQQKNLSGWDGALQAKPGANVRVGQAGNLGANPNDEDIAAAVKTLKDRDIHAEPETIHLKALKTLKDNNPGGDHELVGQIRDEVTKAKEALSKQEDGIRNTKLRTSDQLTQAGQIVTGFTQGMGTTAQSQYTSSQAEKEAEKSADDYVLQAVKRSGDSADSQAQGQGQNTNSAIETLLAGIARSNTPV